MKPYTLPPPSHVRACPFGERRSARVRALYAERCNVAEIALFLGLPQEEVRRTLLRVAPKRPDGKAPNLPRDACGRYLARMAA